MGFGLVWPNDTPIRSARPCSASFFPRGNYPLHACTYVSDTDTLPSSELIPFLEVHGSSLPLWPKFPPRKPIALEVIFLSSKRSSPLAHVSLLEANVIPAVDGKITTRGLILLEKIRFGKIWSHYQSLGFYSTTNYRGYFVYFKINFIKN